MCIRDSLNGPAGLGVHGGKPHHIRLVFAQSLGSLDGVLLAADFLENLGLFRLVVGEIDLVFGVDLVKGRLGDVDVALLDDCLLYTSCPFSKNSASLWAHLPL